jgi:hypothetical protein
MQLLSAELFAILPGLLAFQSLTLLIVLKLKASASSKAMLAYATQPRR